MTGLDDAVRDAFTTSVLLRSGFDSFLFDLIGSDDPADRHTFDERVALCRFLVDQYLDTIRATDTHRPVRMAA